MATVGLVVSDYRRDDGTYNVNIRVFHKAIKKLIETTHYVSERQLDDEFCIKHRHLLLILEKTLIDYRTEISNLGSNLERKDRRLNYFRIGIREKTISFQCIYLILIKCVNDCLALFIGKSNSICIAEFVCTDGKNPVLKLREVQESG